MRGLTVPQRPNKWSQNSGMMNYRVLTSPNYLTRRSAYIYLLYIAPGKIMMIFIAGLQFAKDQDMEVWFGIYFF